MTPLPVLRVRGLSVQVATPDGARTVLEDMSFDVRRGEVLCLAGESGSGKSMTALAIMGLLPSPMARASAGSVTLGDTELLGLDERALRRVRAARVAMIFQEPMTSLNPLMTVGAQLTEVMLEHGETTRREAPARALELLRDVRLAAPERRLAQYPHELSGGMRQRVMIAMALACRPELLIADEPTTALDVTVQAEILELLRRLGAERGTAVILITHDMGVVAEMADRVVVMRAGHTIETADVRTLFAAPGTDYTRELLAAVPRLGAHARGVADERRPASDAAPPVVEALDLTVRFELRGGGLRGGGLLGRATRQVRAVESVSLAIAPGETLALVGESGSGKSTIGRALLSLVPFGGTVRIDGRAIAGLGGGALRRVRRDIQMIFQDPYASLDPRMSVGEQVAEPLRVHRRARGAALERRVAWLFERVGLLPAHRHRHPHELSGGQRQRVCIARALALGPRAIVADECVSALDVSVQAQVLALLAELQREEGIAYLFISHDMAVVEQVAHRVAVLYAGQIVESGTGRQVFGDPRHPYTRRLLAAVPVPDPEHERTPVAERDIAASDAVHAVGARAERVALRDIGGGHLVAS